MNIIFKSRDTIDFSELNFMLHHCTLNLVFMKDFFSKCDQIPRKLWIWSHLLKKVFGMGIENI